MRNCFVPGCDRKHKLPKRTLFNVPKDKSLFDLWAQSLPNLRPLRHTDRVCFLHFQDDDIQNTFNHVIKGQILELPRERPRLKPNAVPILNIPTEEELKLIKCSHKKYLRSPKQQTKLIKHSAEIQVTETLSQIQTDENLNANSSTNESEFIQTTEKIPNSHIKQNDDINNILPEKNNSICEVYQCFFDDIYEVELPNTLWGIHRCPERSMIIFSCMDMLQMSPTKILSISDDGTIKIFINKDLIKVTSLINEENSILMISELLLELDAMT